jgi:hypothetical protein
MNRFAKIQAVNSNTENHNLHLKSGGGTINESMNQSNKSG